MSPSFGSDCKTASLTIKSFGGVKLEIKKAYQTSFTASLVMPEVCGLSYLKLQLEVEMHCWICRQCAS